MRDPAAALTFEAMSPAVGAIIPWGTAGVFLAGAVAPFARLEAEATDPTASAELIISAADSAGMGAGKALIWCDHRHRRTAFRSARS
jgi:hypothetical protein